MIVSNSFTDLTMLSANLEQAKRGFLYPATAKQVSALLASKPLKEQVLPSGPSSTSSTSEPQVGRMSRQMIDQRARDSFSESIQWLQRRVSDGIESIRISREKGEIWIYSSDYQDKTDPTIKAYKLQNQPDNFNDYITMMQYTIDGTPAAIKQLSYDYDQVGKSDSVESEKSTIDVVT